MAVLCALAMLSVPLFEAQAEWKENKDEILERKLRIAVLGIVLSFLFLVLGSSATARECDLGVVQAHINRKIPELKTSVLAYNKKIEESYVLAVYKDGRGKGLLAIPLYRCRPTEGTRSISPEFLEDEVKNPAVEIHTREWRKFKALSKTDLSKKYPLPRKCDTVKVQESLEGQAHFLLKKGFRFLTLSYNSTEQTAEAAIIYPDRTGLVLVRMRIIDCGIKTSGDILTTLEEINVSELQRAWTIPGVETSEENVKQLNETWVPLIRENQKTKP